MQGIAREWVLIFWDFVSSRARQMPWCQKLFRKYAAGLQVHRSWLSYMDYVTANSLNPYWWNFNLTFWSFLLRNGSFWPRRHRFLSCFRLSLQMNYLQTYPNLPISL